MPMLKHEQPNLGTQQRPMSIRFILSDMLH